MPSESRVDIWHAYDLIYVAPDEMDSVAVSVPGRAVAATEKKLRKRKELDAIVAKMNHNRSSREGSVSDNHDASSAAVYVDAGLNTESETSDGGGFGLRSKLIQPSSSGAKTVTVPPILISLCRFPTCRGLVAVVAAAALFIAVVLSVSVVLQTKAQVSEMGLQLDKGLGAKSLHIINNAVVRGKVY